MKNFKNKFFLILFLSSFIATINAQDEKTGDDLSFLKGQKNIKVEFVYDSLTVDGELEETYVSKQVEKMNKKNAGTGDEFLADWKNKKANAGPANFIDGVEEYLVKLHFDVVGNPSIKNGREPIPANPKGPAVKPKYTCVVELISIKSGSKNLITPTMWISCSFYDSSNLTKKLAELKFHLDYNHGGKQGSEYVSTGTWFDISEAYEKAGIRTAKEIKKVLK